MTKTYPSQTIAQKIADKLSKKGTPHEVVEQNGQWLVISEAEKSAAAESAQPETEVLGAVADDSVTFQVMGAKLTPQYVITPVLGSRPRWFERKRLIAAEQIEGGVKITCVRKELTSRGLKDLAAA